MTAFPCDVAEVKAGALFKLKRVDITAKIDELKSDPIQLPSALVGKTQGAV